MTGEKMYPQSTARMFVQIAFGVGLVTGGIVGAVSISVSKAARAADDLHDVKQDYDKAKTKVADDYKAASKKAKEAVENIDAKDLGKAATEGLKDLGHDTKEKAKEFTKAAKNKLLDKWKNRKKGDTAEIDSRTKPE